MRIVLCGKRDECNCVAEYLKNEPTLSFRKLSFALFNDYDEYVSDLKKNGADIVYILNDGADGMEWVFATKAVGEKIPIAWLSNDYSFCTQSYRLGVAYFTGKPTTAEKAVTAFCRCIGSGKHS